MIPNQRELLRFEMPVSTSVLPSELPAVSSLVTEKPYMHWLWSLAVATKRSM